MTSKGIRSAAERRAAERGQGRGMPPKAAVGGCGCGSGQNMIAPGVCSDPICDGGHFYDEIAAQIGCELIPIGVTNGTVAAPIGVNTISVLIPTPDIVDFFLPVRVEFEGRNAADPAATTPYKVTAVRIGAKPQWCMDVTTPTEADGIWNDAFQNQRGRGVPINWGPFSISTRSKQLQITTINPPSGNPALITVHVWGYCIEDLPKPLKCGVFPSRADMAEVRKRLAA